LYIGYEPAPRKLESKEGFFETLRTGWVALFYANLLMFGICMSAVETFLFVYLLNDFPSASDRLIGSTLAMMTVTELPVFQYWRKVSNLGFVRTFTLNHVVLAVKCTLYSVLPKSHPWLVLAIEPLHGFTFAVMWLAAVDFGQCYAPAACKQRFQGLTSGVYFQLSFFCGALIWGPVMKAVGFRSGYILAACVTIAWSVLWNIAQMGVKPPHREADNTEQLLKGEAAAGDEAKAAGAGRRRCCC